jgi:hypothetical protein
MRAKQSPGIRQADALAVRPRPLPSRLRPPAHRQYLYNKDPQARVIFEVHDRDDNYIKGSFSSEGYDGTAGITLSYLLEWIAQSGDTTDVVQFLRDNSTDEEDHGKVIDPDLIRVWVQHT